MNRHFLMFAVMLSALTTGSNILADHHQPICSNVINHTICNLVDRNKRSFTPRVVYSKPTFAASYAQSLTHESTKILENFSQYPVISQ